MKKEKIKINKELHPKGKRIYTLLIFFLMIIFSIVLYRTYNREEKYLVNEGIIENSTICVGYIIKDETVIDIDNTKVLIPTISEGSRVSKNNIIATYRGSEYEQYQKKIQEIDNKILKAMEDIQVEFSVEVENLEEQVLNSVILAKGTSSMVEMQENRNNINNLLSKRTQMIGELGPEEAYVKELIAQRETVQKELTESEANVKASVGGIISYNIDGLENKLTKESLINLNYEDVKEYVNNSESIANNKIKIVSNYEAYILVRADNVENEHIKQDEKYKLKVMGSELVELTGTIVKTTQTEQGYEVLFRVTNGIEKIVESRECELEIVWTAYEGLIVPIQAIKEKSDGKEYVTIITRGDYIDIPVKVQRRNNTYAIVENYEKEKINDYTLERYDQVVIQHN